MKQRANKLPCRKRLLAQTVKRKNDKNIQNKMLYRAFSRQANELTLNIPVLQGLLKVNRQAEKTHEVDKLKIMN